MTTEEAIKVLRNSGYYVDNLWSIHDVDVEGIDMTDDERYKILDGVLRNEWIMEQINVCIESDLEQFKND
jgi:hypothetical protein